MNLLPLGATRRTGRLALDYALSKGYEVVALVRDPNKITTKSPTLTVMSGTPEKPEDVSAATAGCGAVVVTLNNSRTSDLPWAKPTSPKHLIETAVRNIVAAMQAMRFV